MGRLIFKQIDFDHKPLSSDQRIASRKSKARRTPRAADSYRSFMRNSRSHIERCNPSLGGGYRRPIKLNRSRNWKYADNYHDARDLSQSSREVV